MIRRERRLGERKEKEKRKRKKKTKGLRERLKIDLVVVVLVVVCLIRSATICLWGEGIGLDGLEDVLQDIQ